eukprot:7321924-Prymnesium_polylepis.1
MAGTTRTAATPPSVTSLRAHPRTGRGATSGLTTFASASAIRRLATVVAENSATMQSLAHLLRRCSQIHMCARWHPVLLSL